MLSEAFSYFKELTMIYQCLLLLNYAIFSQGKTERESHMTLTSQNSYVAAVFEFSIKEPTAVQAFFPSFFIDMNLRAMARATMEAAEQGAQVIVLPEYGITGIWPDRESYYRLLEKVPDPKKNPNFIACDEDSRSIQILSYLSCLARKHKMYVVANMGEVEDCEPSVDDTCPADGHYHFNTAVVFSPVGKLVAKTRKCHLFFEEPVVNPSPVCEPSAFQTEFGTFGLMICFDAFFANPALKLVEKEGATTIVFPVAMPEILPSFLPIQFMEGFARGMNVNFLAANMQYVLDHGNKMRGSGIFTPQGPEAYQQIHYFGESKLIVAHISKTSQQSCDSSHSNNGCNSRKSPNLLHNLPTKFNAEDVETHRAYIMGSTAKFAVIKEGKHDMEICQGDFCCHARYDGHYKSNKLMVLSAFSGPVMLVRQHPFFAQCCAVLRCKGDYVESCGRRTNLDGSVVFNELVLFANFTTKYILPSVVNDAGRLHTNWTHFKTGSTTAMRVEGSPDKIFMASLFGRWYEMDEMLEKFKERHSDRFSEL